MNIKFIYSTKGIFDTICKDVVICAIITYYMIIPKKIKNLNININTILVYVIITVKSNSDSDKHNSNYSVTIFHYSFSR